MEITEYNLRRELAKLDPDVRAYLQAMIPLNDIPDAYLIAEALDSLGTRAPPLPKRNRTIIVHATKPKRRSGDSR
jgi:hypothetical protein